MKFKIYPRDIAQLLTIIALLLCLASLVGQFCKYVLQVEHQNLITLFNIDAEKNIPSLYAGFQLLLCTLLLKAIAIAKRYERGRYIKYWNGLSIIFLYLAFDEWFSIHEALNQPLNNFLENGFYERWDIFNTIFGIIFIVVYTKFLLHLPKRIKLLFILAGCVYIFGGIAIEFLGAHYFSNFYHKPRFAAQIIFTVEELLEMLGLNLFIYALLLQISSLSIRKLLIEIIDESLPSKKTIQVTNYLVKKERSLQK